MSVTDVSNLPVPDSDPTSNRDLTPDNAPPEFPDKMQPNATACNLDQPIPLPILTPASSPGASLDPQQLAAIALLTSGRSTAAVAALLGVHRTTIYRWKSDPAFAAEFESRRHDLRDTIDARLYRILLHATHTTIAGLKTKDPLQACRHALRVMSTLRPWMPRMDQLLEQRPKEPKNAPTPDTNSQ